MSCDDVSPWSWGLVGKSSICDMKLNSRRTVGLALAMTLLGMVAARGDADAFSFSSIVGRNPFGLKPVPKHVEAVREPVMPAAPRAVVEVTGIENISSPPRVLLEIIPAPGKPMLKPVLTAGQKVDSIEIVSIDVDKAQVLIKNDGVVTNVALKMAKASTPAPPASTSPTARVRSEGAVTPLALPPAEAANGLRRLPSRSMRSGLPQPAIPATGDLSAEAAVIDLEQSRRSNPTSFPPLPPTVLTPRLKP